MKCSSFSCRNTDAILDAILPRLLCIGEHEVHRSVKINKPADQKYWLTEYDNAGKHRV